MKAKPIAGLVPLREVIARHGLSASKALGQNFLLDSQLLDRIARVPGDLDGASASTRSVPDPAA
jgi:16S rRNA (adenine1518-N6/adenine1519-N6)-dimethyltransferase